MNDKQMRIYNKIVTFWESDEGWYYNNREKNAYAKGFLTALKEMKFLDELLNENDEIEILWDLQEALCEMADREMQELKDDLNKTK